MTTVAILPIKTLDSAKQRLAEELDPRPRRALVEASMARSSEAASPMRYTAVHRSATAAASGA